ncbi:DUF2491 family protein [Aureimonas sp. Leaf324]|jgi:hypothetical protein|uniref:DUF2491 family protein n=1 Tax=Aureimonas sp. Leaf324 TaxID=1736336 RepID=UPI0006FE2A13|nr:DUF2491 family protein [Aureimonas sp. Leaf324]KQQ86931.1 hypothetical protein ASF65_19370 [Aureimonas sp. Leaf324]
MIGRFFGWGSGESPAALPAEHGPLGVALGGGIEIDTLSLQAMTAGAQPAMPLPAGGVMLVAAYGEARLDPQTVLSRYYADDNTMLQVLSTSAAPGDELLDVSLYQPWDSVVPAGAADWARWRGPSGLIGQPRYDADGIVFERFWGDGAGRADLVEFVETVNDGQSRREIHQSCMLYARPLGQAREMLLINIERDLGTGASQGASIEFILGYGLMAADVRRL